MVTLSFSSHSSKYGSTYVTWMKPCMGRSGVWGVTQKGCDRDGARGGSEGGAKLTMAGFRLARLTSPDSFKSSTLSIPSLSEYTFCGRRKGGKKRAMEGGREGGRE